MTSLITIAAALLLVLLYLWRAAVADSARLRVALALAQAELNATAVLLGESQFRRVPPPPHPPPGCQTVCDRECSRFDDCRGEAWVCINLFELLQSDTGPVPLFSQCHGALKPPLRRAMRTLLQRAVATAASVDVSAIRGDTDLQDYARHLTVPRSKTFQRAAEEITHLQSPTRRVRFNALTHAAAKGWTLNKLHRELTSYGCQPHGLSLPHLARTRTFNSSWRTFHVSNDHQDALMFMLDLVVQVRGAPQPLRLATVAASPHEPSTPTQSTNLPQPCYDCESAQSTNL